MKVHFNVYVSHILDCEAILYSKATNHNVFLTSHVVRCQSDNQKLRSCLEKSQLPNTLRMQMPSSHGQSDWVQ